MSLDDSFIHRGRVTGRDHLRAGRDGQDGYALVETVGLAAAVVTDGCSSGGQSELGARLGARWLAALVVRLFDAAAPVAFAHVITRALVAHLRVTARSLSPGRTIDAGIVGDALLFGFLVAVVTAKGAIVFGVGDGVVWVDGTATVIDPGPENAPPYPAYALLGATIAPTIHFHGACRTVVIATDGAGMLVPQLAALATDPRLFQNRSLLRKRLNVLAKGVHLWDDTTIAIVRAS